MKKILFIAPFFTLAFLIASNLDALDGRGGGRGSRGGAMRRMPSMNGARFPSESHQLRDVEQRRDFVERRSPTRMNVENFLGRSPLSQGIEGLEGGDRTLDASTREGLEQFRQNLPQRTEWRREIGNNIRENIRETYPNHAEWFNENFWNRQDGNQNFFLRNGNAWKWATWFDVNRWANNRWDYPYYYDYGGFYYNGYDGFDDGGNGYIYSDQEVPSTFYVEEGQNSQDQATDGNWMPLGVFAITGNGQEGTYHNYIQLALNRNGDLAGTYYNAANDKAYPLEGIVDETTQRAAWMMTDSKNAPIMQTGIYNLTQNETPVRVTFADGSTQTMLLVRLQDPSQGVDY